MRQLNGIKPIQEVTQQRFEVKYEDYTLSIRYEKNKRSPSCITEDVHFRLYGKQHGMFQFRAYDRDYNNVRIMLQGQPDVPEGAIEVFRKILPEYVNRLILDSKQARQTRRKVNADSEKTLKALQTFDRKVEESLVVSPETLNRRFTV